MGGAGPARRLILAGALPLIAPRLIRAILHRASGRIGALALGSGAVAGGYEALGDGFDDLLVDLVDAEIAFDEDDAVWLAGGDFAIFLPGAAVEGFLLLFEAVFVAARLLISALVAMTGTGQAGFKGG